MINKFHPLRVSAAHEDLGLNISEHGEDEDPDRFDLRPDVRLGADGIIALNSEAKQFENKLEST